MWKSYKEHLVRLRSLFKDRRWPRINVEEGDAYIRFYLTDDYGLNKTYFLFELENLSPRVKWRNLIRQAFDAHPALLSRRVCLLPVYGYSFDRIFTLTYWGKEQPFFDPNQLRRLGIKSLLFTIPRPSSAFASAANFIWLKSMERAWHDLKALSELSKQYVFNALYPPELEDVFNLWHEAPFVLVSDRQLDIFTAHKTICRFDLSGVTKSRERGLLKLRVLMLDSKLNARGASCLLPEEHFKFVEERSVKDAKKAVAISEAIAIKHVRVYDREALVEPIFEMYIYPFESSDLFSGEAPGPLMTLASVILRRLYFNSPDPLRLQVTQEGIRHKMLTILRNSPFKCYKWNDFISCMLQSPRGMDFIIQCLSVYHAIGNDIFYLHPSIVENLSVLCKGLDHLLVMKSRDLKDLVIRSLEVFEYARRHQEKLREASYLIDLREVVERKLGFCVDYDLLRQFISSSKVTWESIIPVSKLLSSPSNRDFAVTT